MISTWETVCWFVLGIFTGAILSNPKKYFN